MAMDAVGSSTGAATPPSVEGISPQPFPSGPPGMVVRLVLGLHERLKRIAYGVVPPFLLGFDLTTAIAATLMLGAIARFRIPDALANGPLTAEEIAARTGTNADAVHRTLRALAYRGVFTLRPDGRFALNAVSKLLVSGHIGRGREWALYFSSASNVAAWVDFPETLRTGKNAFERVHGMSVWDWFDAHPDERECFAQCMMATTIMDAPVVATLFPFHEVKTLCDVGGGRGTLLSEILIRHPHLKGVLCDGAGVIESARPFLAARGVSDRVTCAPGSFFQSVPSGSDAYLLKNILHDWDDARSLQILAACRKAMQAGQRVLVVETLTEKNELGVGVLADVHMMVVASDGRERGREEYGALFARSGFTMGRVFAQPTIAVIEGVAV
jgi:hypothetical protein